MLEVLIILATTNAPMELFGLGPEMFADRGKAWVEAIAVVLESLIAKIGVLVLAFFALRKTVVSNAHLEKRLDRQAARIDNVALAAPSSSPPALDPDAPPITQPSPIR